MSLIVDLYDPETGAYLDAVSPDMAGPEAYRWRVWSCPAVRATGASMLPTLARTDLWVPVDQVTLFVTEVQGIRHAVDQVSASLGGDPSVERLLSYLERFERVGALALERGVGVCIT